jgi:hypothetical protein
MASRMGKYFGSSGRQKHSSPQHEFDHYRRKAEEWVRHNPTAAITIAALAGAMLISSRGLRKIAIPIGLMALRRWMR